MAFPPGFQGDPNEFRMRDPLSHGIPDGDLRKHRDFAVWYATKWTRRVIDAIDQFSPDFIYFDGGGSYPFCGHGTGRGLRADATPRVIAHLYNKSIAKNGGRLEAMAFTKGNEDPRAVAVNCESQVPGDIKRDCTWQTENGLGEWFYLKGTFYDSGMVIHQMLEAISRDGNYAINIPLTPAGELDPGGLKTLQDMGDWMNVNSEGIHGSSAWDVWGEGKVAMAGGNLNESHARTPYTGQDIRFTAKNGAVYAWLMAWPAGGKVMIHSLAEGAGKIEEVKLLGCPVKLDWRQTEEGLVVCLQKQRPCEFAYGLKIVGRSLKAVSPKARAIKPAADGSLTLDPEAAEPQGGVKPESRGGPMNFGYWGSGSDFVVWSVDFAKAGEFQVFSQAACPYSGVALRLEADGAILQAGVPNTGSHDRYVAIDFGVLRIKRPGTQTVRIRPADPQTWRPANLRAVSFRPLPGGARENTDLPPRDFRLAGGDDLVAVGAGRHSGLRGVSQDVRAERCAAGDVADFRRFALHAVGERRLRAPRPMPFQSQAARVRHRRAAATEEGIELTGGAGAQLPGHQRADHATRPWPGGAARSCRAGSLANRQFLAHQREDRVPAFA